MVLTRAYPMTANRCSLSHNPVELLGFDTTGYETGFQDRLIESLSLEATRADQRGVAVASTHRFRDRRREGHLASTRCMTPKLDPRLGLHFGNVLGDALRAERGFAGRLSGVTPRLS